MKKVYYSIFAILILSALFVLADYFALFGAKTNVKLDFAEGTFRTINEDTGELVAQVFVSCIQEFTQKACTQRESGRGSIVSVHVPLKRIVKESFFFTQSEQIEKTADPEIHIKFIHPDYRNPFETFQVQDFYAGKFKEHVIKMTPVDWGEVPEDE